MISQLGPDTDRIAALLSEPLRVIVNGVATIDHSANVAALERRLNQLDSQTAPDDQSPASLDNLVAIPLIARTRR
ncbi:hypothetical protein AB0I68_18690 [Streptomyces sp. NPDC050448]|uniref:hypothetical protein n=1 Tax=Streptomyces sp. NPDC050448 TaxID=3155404 RepID=UPI003422718D